MNTTSKTISGAGTITKANYLATHGAENFRKFVENCDATFVGRKASGVYVIRATAQVVVGIACFAGFSAMRVERGHDKADVWVVQRVPGVNVIDASC